MKKYSTTIKRADQYTTNSPEQENAKKTKRLMHTARQWDWDRDWDMPIENICSLYLSLSV